MRVAGATKAAAPLRKRVRRESFTEWLPKSSHPRFSVNYVSFPVRQHTPRLTVSLSCASAEARIVAANGHERAEPETGLLLLPGGRLGWLRRARVGRRLSAASICRLRQWGRIVRLGIQECDDVCTLAATRHAGKAHLGAGDETARTGQELVEIVDRPVAA